MLLHLFVIKLFIIIFYYFYIMAIVLMRETRLLIVMDDFEFWIKNVAFEVKMFNKYGIFDQITNRNMKNLRYAYLHCDLLDKVALTTIALNLKLVHIKMHEQHL
jgi:hypothetical protein